MSGINVHGTCGHCGGRVVTPVAWMGINPPIPTCENCHAQVKQPHGAVLDMGPKPEPYPKNLNGPLYPK